MNRSAQLEDFRDEPFRRWTGIAGRWEVEERVAVSEVERKVIYRSPEEPSHLAWVGIWKAADGSISIRFPQITGNVGLEPSYAPWYGRANFANHGVKSWEELAAQISMTVGPADALSTTRVDYITMTTRDGGDTWETVSVVHRNTTGWRSAETRGYNTRLVLAANGSPVGKGPRTLLCRDGRIVDTANLGEWGGTEEDWKAGRRFLLGLRESFDHGKTWSSLQWVAGKFGDGRAVTEATEENDLVELDDGRLLFIIRSTLQHPMAAWIRRQADGRYTCDAVEVVTSMPHAGKPAMIRTDDGTIWYWGERHFYSLDEGKTWQGLPDAQAYPAYYGEMLAAGNRVLNVTQKDIGDAPYPYRHDASVEQIRFSGRRMGVMKQTDSQASLALVKLSDSGSRNLHLRVDVRADQAEGVAFRISPDGKSYYAFMILMPETEVCKRWEPPSVQGATLSAYFPGVLDEHVRDRIEKGIIKVLPAPTAVLARVDNGHVNVLRGYRIGALKPGSWLQLQVKLCGEVIQAAVSDRSSLPTYLGVSDATYGDGAVGLLTDGGSLGAFKNLALWSGPRMIRDLWTPDAI